MMKVQDLMSSPVITIRPGATFKEVVTVMLDNDVSGIPVVTGSEQLLGIVTEADLLPKEAFGAKARPRILRAVASALSGATPSLFEQAEGITAADLMTERVIVAYPEEDARYAAQRMLQEGVKRLPVVSDGRLVGIVSRADLLRAFEREDAELARALTHQLHAAHYRPPQNDVSIGVADGVAHLSGVVLYERDVKIVESIVSNAEGVVGVINELSFRENDPPEHS